MLQASVDENCDIILRLLSTVPVLISDYFEEAKIEADSVARDSSEGDENVYNTIFNNIYGSSRPEDKEWMIDEFYRSMYMLIFSYVETTIKGLLMNPNERFGSDYLCKAYNQLRKENSFRLKKIGQYWKGQQDFRQKRDDIAHNRREVSVSKEELLGAIDGIHALLRAIADAFYLRDAYNTSS